MDDHSPLATQVYREALLHGLYEAAELEHNLMCTYLYAAFSLKDEQEGLSAEEGEAVRRWRRVLMDVAIEEMGHLTAVWNITSALGGTPRIGRANFPLDPGNLPASVVVRLAPFTRDTLQHFIYLERPRDSQEPDGPGFVSPHLYQRGNAAARLTPMGMDYATVGDFYLVLGATLRAFVEQQGDEATFCGEAGLQLSPQEVTLTGAKRVICLKTALAAFEAIVLQGEGAAEAVSGSHYQRFVGVREEYDRLKAANPAFEPAHPAATNPVLRSPPRPEGRVWIEHAESVATVDLANASYGLMLRLIGYAYSVPGPSPEKALAVSLSLGLMRALVPLAEHAARLPAGPSNPQCNAGISFTTLRDASPFPRGLAARRFFIERLLQLEQGAAMLAQSGAQRLNRAAEQIADLRARAQRGFSLKADQAPAPAAAMGAATPTAAAVAPVATRQDGVESVRGDKLELEFEARRCIHARFCVTGAPKVFLANTPGDWIYPDAMPVERVVEIAHACPSGAIRYRRLDGAADETAPPVNLASVREGGPYAFRGDLKLDGESLGYRATLCRCGASKNKPYCDGSHHDAGFSASGEPPSGDTTALAMRDGPLSIEPELDGPLCVSGALEIISGTGRVVARTQSTRLCRCGHSGSKPFCDGSHARVGFRSRA